MASTVSNGNDRSEKWQRSSQMERSFQMATTVYEREIGIVDLQKFTSVAVLWKFESNESMSSELKTEKRLKFERF